MKGETIYKIKLKSNLEKTALTVHYIDISLYKKSYAAKYELKLA